MRGRGVVVEAIAQVVLFNKLEFNPATRSGELVVVEFIHVDDLDQVLRQTPADTPLTVGIISRGEHVERPGMVLNPAQHQQTSPSGVTGSHRNHQFRASGWTRHYQTFAELMQMIALLALGLALANLRNHGANKYFRVAILAAALLTLGLVFTAMRTVIVAFVIGAAVIAFRSLRGTYKVVFTFALFFVLAFGAVVVWQTRDRNALSLGDPSSSLRMQVARVGLSRIPIHPIFGHGMDAMKMHWTEWGFPGKDMLHLHSTPLQLAFDRGLPMLALWLWMVIAFWLTIARAERSAADLSDTNSYGILLGTLGALTGFLVSSLVNYNYGDAEVAMMFWFLMGAVISQQTDNRSRTLAGAGAVVILLLLPAPAPDFTVVLHLRPAGYSSPRTHPERGSPHGRPAFDHHCRKQHLRVSRAHDLPRCATMGLFLAGSDEVRPCQRSNDTSQNGFDRQIWTAVTP